MTYADQMRRAWQRCEEFNNAHPIGTRVVYRPVRGSDNGKVDTATRSLAWALPCGQPVVLVERKSGGVSLDHLEIIG